MLESLTIPLIGKSPVAHTLCKESTRWHKYIYTSNVGNDTFTRGKAPLYNHMEKADFLNYEFEAPNGISLIMFQDSSVKFSA